MKKKKIELMIKDFRNKIKSLENIIITLKNHKNNPYKYNKEIKKFFFDFNSALKKETNFDREYFYNLNETKLERYLLIYFQYKIIKLKTLYDMIKGILELFL